MIFLRPSINQYQIYRKQDLSILQLCHLPSVADKFLGVSFVVSRNLEGELSFNCFFRNGIVESKQGRHSLLSNELRENLSAWESVPVFLGDRSHSRMINHSCKTITVFFVGCQCGLGT